MTVNLISKSLLQHVSRTNFMYRNGSLLNVFSASKFNQVCFCSSTVFQLTSKLPFLTFTKNVNTSSTLPEKWNHKRFYCSESGPPSNRLPPLMNIPKLVWPSFIKSIRNFILATFIIRPYLDQEFSLSEFVLGSKKAVEVVSNKISSGDLKSLQGLVTNDILPTLQAAVASMSLSQREQLAISVDDIYFSFPYQIGIIFDDEDKSKEQKRYVEITMVYHTLRGLANMRSRGEEPPINMGMLPEFQSKISICNYRFIREFTKGVESDWTVNLLNHFKPADDLENSENS